MPSKICINKNALVFIVFFLILAATYIYTVNKITATKVVFQPKAAEVKTPPRIFGGTEVTDPTKWPFMVHIYKKYTLGGIKFTDALCSGTLIEPSWVLTAGHCAPEPNSNVYTHDEIIITHGIKPLKQASTKDIYKIKGQIHRHQLFNKPGYLDNDIALYELDRPVEGSEKIIKTISLNEDPKIETETITPGQYRYGVILGYGATESDDFNENLYQAVVPILSNIRANKPYWLKKFNNFTLNKTQITSGYPLGGTNSCGGDSGGALIVWNGKKWVQVGISSAGSPSCGDIYSPGIFTRVSSYIDWIKSEINKTPKRTGVCYPSCDFIYHGSYDPTKGTFTGTGKELSVGDLREFNCRINNIGSPPIGAQYKCGSELKDDDKQP